MLQERIGAAHPVRETAVLVMLWQVRTERLFSGELIERGRLFCQGSFVQSIAAGAEHSVVSLDTGEAYAWGWGRYGNLGDGNVEDRWVPTKVITGVLYLAFTRQITSSILLSTTSYTYLFYQAVLLDCLVSCGELVLALLLSAWKSC